MFLRQFKLCISFIVYDIFFSLNFTFIYNFLIYDKLEILLYIYFSLACNYSINKHR